jgi:hypothetical protein
MGNTKYLHSSIGYIELTSNPLTKINSHGHRKNHPSGYKPTKNVVEILRDKTDGSWCSIYPFSMYMDIAAAELGIKEINTLDTKTIDPIFIKIKQDYCDMWDYLGEQNIPRIHVVLPKNLGLYKLSSVRTTDRQLLKPIPYESAEHYDQTFLDLFFKDSMSQYDNGVKTKWDLREFMALNFREYPYSSEVDSNIDLTGDHKLITAPSLWHDGDEKVIEIFDYLQLSFNKDRMESWIPIYRQWQKVQMKILNFVYDIDYIVDGIVHNHNFDLRPYNLNIKQEAIIQHFLIYKHGLTLKNWNLEKFPNNTKDLHSLLEPNFHTIPKLY